MTATEEKARPSPTFPFTLGSALSRVDKWTLTVALVFVSVVFLGSGNDPHVYLSAWAAVGVFAVCIALRMVGRTRASTEARAEPWWP